MTCLVLVLVIFATLARARERPARASAHSSALRIDEAGYYLVEFRGAVGANVIRRARHVLGYEPRDYVPPNQLMLWIDSAERGAALLSELTHIRAVRPVDRAARHIDMARAINSLKIQHSAAVGVHAANATRTVTPLDASVRMLESFEHDGGALVVRLRVRAFNTSAEELLTSAQPTCRTHVHLVESDPSSNHFVLGGVHCDDAARVTDALVSDARVARVEMRSPFFSLNRWSTETVRTGAFGVAKPTIAALRGAGQILSMSDTGVATGTCFFADTDNTAVPRTSSQQVPADTGHRKVRAYWSGVGGDFEDRGTGAGHGTHVAGTAVGSALDGSDERSAQFGGAAPDARLAFVDLLPLNGGNFLRVPLNLDSTLMRWSSDAGARVHSASWGSDSGGRYGFDEQSLDRFVYENRHFLVLFAAGNSGADGISSPAMAKNVLAVGSTLNSVGSIELAQTPPRPADDFEPDWLSSFSSRGSLSHPFAKPDIVAPGGPYVWSADAGSAERTLCGSLSSSVLGFQGTSMATPVAAGSALLLREYFVKAVYPNSVGVGDEVDTAEPTASLLRALLAASGQPMRGIYPRKTFLDSEEHRRAVGHGRIALDAVLESPRVQLAVLSNEQSHHGLVAGRSVSWCVKVLGVESGAYDIVTVALAYADYPSAPASQVTLVNDLRLSVRDESGGEYKVNERTSDERRSTIERVRVSGVTRFTVTVSADTLGFGDVQTFSLALVLQRADGSESGWLSVSAASPLGETCESCEGTGDWLFTGDCAVCGDGVVDATREECDSSSCCDPSTCRLLDDASPCTIVAGDCRLLGECIGGECSADTSLAYAVKSSADGGLCDAMDADEAPPSCVYKSAAVWRSAVALNRALVAERDWSLCCAPLWAVLEQIEFDEIFAELSREYVAALLNSVQPNAVNTVEFLLDIELTRQLLAEHCGVGFAHPDERATANALLGTLRRTNERCTGEGAPVERDDACSSDVDSSSALSYRLCSGGGVFDRATGECACHSNRQPGESDCAHLACSGHGVSLYDYALGAEQCVCFDGWAGVTCGSCEREVPGDSIRRICMGLPLSVAEVGRRRHALLYVDTSSIGSRLSGDYYPASIAKHTDALPNTDGLDCACRDRTEVESYLAYDSHIEAVRADLASRELNDALVASALSAIKGAQPPTITTPRLRSAAVRQMLSIPVTLAAVILASRQ
jgi:hypothetical protein